MVRPSARRAYVFSAAAILALALTLAVSPIANAESLSTWTLSSNSYGGGQSLADSSCVTYSGYIYCIGGNVGGAQSNAVYYAPFSSGTVGSWSSTTSYPTVINNGACAVDSGGYVYCVGGDSSSGIPTSAVYSAQLSSGGGITAAGWAQQTAYTVTTAGTTSGGEEIYYESCAIYLGYIYCVAGYNYSPGSAVSASVYSAPVSSGTLGAWSQQTNYGAALEGESCATSSGYIYCVGGLLGFSQSSDVFFASLSSGSITGWTRTTDYGAPSTSDQTGFFGVPGYLEGCAASSNGYMYCTGANTGTGTYGTTNKTYFAQLSSSGAGVWTATTPYPVSTGVYALSCVAPSDGYIYCLGGAPGSGSPSSAVYSAQIASPVPDLPYGVIPLLLAIPALYFLISRRQTARGTTGTIGSGK